MNLLLLLDILAISGSVVCVKALLDSFKGEGEKFKYDTVTDLRLKRKAFNDSKYKNIHNKNNGAKGI